MIYTAGGLQDFAVHGHNEKSDSVNMFLCWTIGNRGLWNEMDVWSVVMFLKY